MYYRDLIIEMIKQIKNESYLRKIYIFVKAAFEKERGQN